MFPRVKRRLKKEKELTLKLILVNLVASLLPGEMFVKLFKIIQFQENIGLIQIKCLLLIVTVHCLEDYLKENFRIWWANRETLLAVALMGHEPK